MINVVAIVRHRQSESRTHFINQAAHGLLIPDQSHFIQLIESNSLEFMEMKPSPHNVMPHQQHIIVCEKNDPAL